MADIKTTAVQLYGEPSRSPEGFLFVPVVFMEKRVMDYGTQKELPDFDVTDTALLTQISGLPFVLEHPQDETGAYILVDPENYDDFIVGVVVEPTLTTIGGRPAILAKLKIWDLATIDLIESGELSEVSQGYRARLIDAPGEYMGEPYDYLQTGFSFNHLALVTEGRNGDKVKVLYNQMKLNQKGANMKGKNVRGMRPGLKVNADGQPADSASPVEPIVPKPDEQMVNQDGTPEERIAALEEGQAKILQILQQLIPSETAEEVPPAGTDVQAAVNACAGPDEKVMYNSIARATAQHHQEYQKTYFNGRVFLGADIDTEIHRFNTLDAFRRHCLQSQGVLSSSELMRMNSNQVTAYFDVAARMKADDVNAPRFNGQTGVGQDTYVTLAGLSRQR